MSSADTKYMQRALKLAQRGSGSVEPNPMVGCVIVKAGQAIGIGWHKKFGEAHAEIVALEDCKSLGATPQGSTMYVTLEPCCHRGKTGPCTDAIIAAGVSRVVVATLDPSPHASGKGIEKLRQKGIDVEVGLCRTEARLLNAPFIKHAASGRCWTVLKWAQSIDGRVAWAASEQEQGRRWISNELSRKDVHALRRRVGAVLVGINTVLADDPLLTARPARGSKPLRVVMDSSLRIPLGCRLLKTPKSGSVLIYASLEAIEQQAKKADRIRAKGAELIGFPDAEQSNLRLLIDELSRRGVAQLLVEGGPMVLASFLQEQLADEICIYMSPRIFGALGGAEMTTAMAQLSDLVELEHIDVTVFDGDVRLRALTKRAAEEVLS